MTFKTNMQSDVDDVLLDTTEFAESITYDPYSGSDSEISVIWESMGVQERVIGDDLQEVATARVHISTTDIASVDTRDSITRSGTSWSVREVLHETAEETIIEAVTRARRYIQGARIRGKERGL
jgi:hypothetical protein